ncbi:MAG: hypothetical protein IKM97_03855 [Clostridia bacterium]|nr:hypothetical protein [Clostridia bacterium]
MKIEEVKKKTEKRILAIYDCFKNGYIEESLILLYSTIDSISWLYSDETNVDKRKPGCDFMKFSKDYYLPYLTGYDISVEELYLARCSVVHTSSSLARNQKQNRQFQYSTSEDNRNVQNNITKLVCSTCISINIKDLILALKFSIEKFFDSLSINKINEIDKKTENWYVDCIIE